MKRTAVAGSAPFRMIPAKRAPLQPYGRLSTEIMHVLEIRWQSNAAHLQSGLQLDDDPGVKYDVPSLAESCRSRLRTGPDTSLLCVLTLAQPSQVLLPTCDWAELDL